MGLAVRLVFLLAVMRLSRSRLRDICDICFRSWKYDVSVSQVVVGMNGMGAQAAFSRDRSAQFTLVD